MPRKYESEGGAYWRKLEEARKIGLSGEQFERIEAIEHAIFHFENMIVQYKNIIKDIVRDAKAIKRKKEREGIEEWDEIAELPF